MSKTAHIVLGAPDEHAVYPSPLSDDIVIGVDRGAFLCLERNINLDIAVGDFDSISLEEKEALQATVALFQEHESDKDDTDAEIALSLAMKDDTIHHIRLYNWAGGRLDHLMSIVYMVHQPRFLKKITAVTLVNQLNTIRFFDPGTFTLKKEPSKKYLSFICMTPVEKLTLKNVKYTLDRKTYTHPAALVSNEFLAPHCEFSFEKGIMAVIQSSDK